MGLNWDWGLWNEHALKRGGRTQENISYWRSEDGQQLSTPAYAAFIKLLALAQSTQRGLDWQHHLSQHSSVQTCSFRPKLLRRQQAAERSALTSASQGEGEDKQAKQSPLQLAQLLKDAIMALVNQW